MPERLLSIVVPAYNEARFIGTLLERIRAVDLSPFDIEREILVVDDGSTDDTAAIAAAAPGVRLIRQARNQGKGAAVRAGLACARGDVVLIQDADLEYDPADHAAMLAALDEPGVDAVYGSRYLRRRGQRAWANPLRGKHPDQGWAAYLGGRGLSLVAFLATGHAVSDTVTALKMFARPVVCDLVLETSGFELDHEITAKILARGHTLVEVPVAYHPRSRAEGKKIGLRDFVRAIVTFARYRRG